MSDTPRFRWFRQDQCRLCGRCLQACPVLELPEQAAVAEKKRLLSSSPEASLALRYCVTCNICDRVCPQNAAPYELVLECFDRRANDRGLPYIAKMVLPDEPENIWSALRPLMSRRERDLLTAWDKALEENHEQLILTGFYTNLVPFLADLGVIRDLGLPIAGSEGLWGCGGDTNKMGLIGQTEAVVTLIDRVFQKMAPARVYCFMEAEAAMLTEILPRYYGACFDFEALPLDDLILSRLRSGDIGISKPLGLTVTVHDNCMSRYFNGRPQQVIREILAKTGCHIREMAHNREKALCCGWAATIPTLYTGSGNPFATMAYLLYSLNRRLTEAERTGAEALVTGCPACFLFLTLIKVLTNARIEVFHLLEIVDMAQGGQPVRKAEERCWEILAQSSTLMLNWTLAKKNRRRFFPRPIEAGSPRPPAPASLRDAVKTARFERLYKSRLTQNALVRAMLAAAVRLTARLYQSWLDRQKSCRRRPLRGAP